MMLNEQKMTYNEWLFENSQLLEERYSQTQLHQMYENYLKNFNNHDNPDS